MSSPFSRRGSAPISALIFPAHPPQPSASSPALPTTQACWDRHCHPRDAPPPPRPSLPPPSTRPHRGLPGAFPHIPSLQDITSTLPCPVSCRADVAGIAVGGGEEPHGERDPQSWLPPGSLPWATHIHMDIYTGWERASSPARPRGSPCTPPTPPSRTDPTRIKRLGMSQNKYFTVNYQG